MHTPEMPYFKALSLKDGSLLPQQSKKPCMQRAMSAWGSRDRGMPAADEPEPYRSMVCGAAPWGLKLNTEVQ